MLIPQYRLQTRLTQSAVVAGDKLQSIRDGKVYAVDSWDISGAIRVVPEGRTRSTWRDISEFGLVIVDLNSTLNLNEYSSFRSTGG